MCGHFRSETKGFTLVELLVCVVIVAVLCILGVASYRNLVDNAQSVKCVANLRSISSATLAFAVDRNGMLWKRADVGYSAYRMAMDPMGPPKLLEEYVSNKNVWMCPAGRSTLKIFENNYAWTAAKQFDETPLILASSMMKTPLYWDAYNYSMPSMHNAYEPENGGPSTLKSQFHYKPHRSKKHVNWAFADGHVITGATAAQ